jgi:hypothetical protein
LERDRLCGCFNCLAIFDPREITEWVDSWNPFVEDGGITAICPYCDMDTIIGDGSGYPMTRVFLREMREVYLAGGV